MSIKGFFLFAVLGVSTFAVAQNVSLRVGSGEDITYLDLKTSENLSVLISPKSAPKIEVCFLGESASDAAKILFRLVRNTGLINSKGEVIISKDKNGEDLSSVVAIKYTDTTATLKVEYEYENKPALDIYLVITACVQD